MNFLSSASADGKLDFFLPSAVGPTLNFSDSASLPAFDQRTKSKLDSEVSSVAKSVEALIECSIEKITDTVKFSQNVFAFVIADCENRLSHRFWSLKETSHLNLGA